MGPTNATSGNAEAFTALVMPVVQTYTTILRPWSHFFTFRRPEPGENIQAHVEKNLVHFQANYLLIAAVYLLVMLLGQPIRLIASAAVVAVWACYARVGGFDPNWKPQLLGVDVSSMLRLVML